jgi:hypothetical protein
MNYEQAEVTQREALKEAQSALAHLSFRVQRNFYGDVEGVDSVHFALRALASTLAQLFEGPDDGPDELDIKDVVAFLVARNRLPKEALLVLSRLIESVKQAAYQGLSDEDVDELEEARELLYDYIDAMLVQLKEEEERLNG